MPSSVTSPSSSSTPPSPSPPSSPKPKQQQQQHQQHSPPPSSQQPQLPSASLRRPQPPPRNTPTQSSPSAPPTTQQAQQPPAQSYKLTISVPRDAVGFIIGKRGETVRNMMARSHAHIYVDRDDNSPNAPERLFHIQGTQRAIATARALIKEKVYAVLHGKPHARIRNASVLFPITAQQQQQLAQQTSQQPHQQHQPPPPPQFSQPQLSQQLPQPQQQDDDDDDDLPPPLEMWIPRSCVGMIIGHGGQVINEMQEKARATIVVHNNKMDTTTGSKLLTISGGEAEKQHAKQLIEQVLARAGTRAASYPHHQHSHSQRAPFFAPPPPSPHPQAPPWTFHPPPHFPMHPRQSVDFVNMQPFATWIPPLPMPHTVHPMLPQHAAAAAAAAAAVGRTAPMQAPHAAAASLHPQQLQMMQSSRNHHMQPHAPLHHPSMHHPHMQQMPSIESSLPQQHLSHPVLQPSQMLMQSAQSEPQQHQLHPLQLQQFQQQQQQQLHQAAQPPPISSQLTPHSLPYPSPEQQEQQPSSPQPQLSLPPEQQISSPQAQQASPSIVQQPMYAPTPSQIPPHLNPMYQQQLQASPQASWASSQVPYTHPSQLGISYERAGLLAASNPMFKASAKTVRVPSSCVGLVIGRNGETIRELQQRSGAQIKMSASRDANGEDGDRVMHISGTAAAVEIAHTMINELVNKALSTVPKDEVEASDEASGEASGSAGAGEQQQASTPDVETPHDAQPGSEGEAQRETGDSVTGSTVASAAASSSLKADGRRTTAEVEDGDIEGCGESGGCGESENGCDAADRNGQRLVEGDTLGFGRMSVSDVLHGVEYGRMEVGEVGLEGNSELHSDGTGGPVKRADRAYANSNNNNKVWTEMKISPSKVGLIIGKKGATIRVLENKSGARIWVSKKTEAGGEEQARTVSIRGRRAGVEAARRLIQSRIGPPYNGVDDDEADGGGGAGAEDGGLLERMSELTVENSSVAAPIAAARGRKLYAAALTGAPYELDVDGQPRAAEL